MARAQGARAQMALAYETVYGTPPVSGFRLMPFARTTLGSEQPLLESELLDALKSPEDRVRYRARLELTSRKTEEVIAATSDWIGKLDKKIIGSGPDFLK